MVIYSHVDGRKNERTERRIKQSRNKTRRHHAVYSLDRLHAQTHRNAVFNGIVS